MPAMTPDELRTLGEDIRQNGLRSPIVLFIPGCYDDDDEPSAAVLLDGKNRLDALEAAGFTPRFTQDVDPRLADRDIVTSLDLDAATFWPVEHLYEWDGGERLDPWEIKREIAEHEQAIAAVGVKAAKPKRSEDKVIENYMTTFTPNLRILVGDLGYFGYNLLDRIESEVRAMRAEMAAEGNDVDAAASAQERKAAMAAG
jgi:hypothetical protein